MYPFLKCPYPDFLNFRVPIGYLQQFCNEKNIFFLVDHTKTIHSRKINRSKLHLNKSGSIILSYNFVKAISSILHWYKIDSNNKGCLEVEECSSVPQNVSFNIELNSMRIKHVNKLIIAHLNINSLRNKFEFLVEFIRGKDDILIISETEIDESFSLGQFKGYLRYKTIFCSKVALDV